MGLVQQPVYVAGQDGYHTYRIPAAVTTAAGNVLAFCEGRRDDPSDTGNIDVVLRRSLDGGATWEPLQVLWDDGDNTCGNPCAVVDRETDSVWLLLTHNIGSDNEASIWDGTADGTRTVWAMSSDDQGATWTKPTEITATVKAADWTWYATGPGIGVQLDAGEHSGRLLIPCDHGIAGTKHYHAHAIYSDDHGASWQRSDDVPDPTTSECQLAELADGTVVLNIRNHFRKTYHRAISTSTDGGHSWSKPKRDSALIDPHCQASLLRYDGDATGADRRQASAKGPGLLLFSNPAAKTRSAMTVRRSSNGGRAWPSARRLHRGPSAYSCLAQLPDGRVGCFYERGTESPYEEIALARFDLEWLAAGIPGIETSE